MSTERPKAALGTPQEQSTSGTDTLLPYTSTPESSSQTTFGMRDYKVYAVKMGDVRIVVRGASPK